MREAKLDKGLKEIGNFENLYVARLTKLVDKNDGREKDDRKEDRDKGTVSWSDTCFSVYHLYREACPKFPTNFPFFGLSSLLSIEGITTVEGC